MARSRVHNLVMPESPNPVYLWDDNPTLADLLGFDILVEPLLSALEVESVDPVTLGIHGNWGSGKSTVLGLIGEALEQRSTYVVIRVNPWEFDDVSDVRGTLISHVLAPLIEHRSDSESFREKATGLLRRISWARVGNVMANGAMGSWDLEELVEAFRPDGNDGPDSMSGFRLAFDELLQMLNDVERVVVLVDDLDRCLPNAVLATLEAIKLFLGVPKMAFILAADPTMVKDAIGGALAATGRSDLFAERYIDKIIQIPVSLPLLSPLDAEHYIVMLLSRQHCDSVAEFDSLLDHVDNRRAEAKTPLLDEIPTGAYSPPEWIRTLSAQITQGLSTDSIGNPREIKRFLNAFGIRTQIARTRDVEIAPDVLVKLLILEDRYPDDFRRLASCPNTEQTALVRDWERWANDQDGSKIPEGLSTQSADWARTEPSLSGVEISRYLTLAAALSSTPSAFGLNETLIELFDQAVSESQAVRNVAVKSVSALEVEQQQQIVLAVVGRVRRNETAESEIEFLVRLAAASPGVAQSCCQAIRESCWEQLTPRLGLLIASSSGPCLTQLANDILSDQGLPETVKEAVRQAQQGVK